MSSTIETAARKLAKKARSKKGYTDKDVQAVVEAVRECDVIDKKLNAQYREAAQAASREGEIEVDDDAVVSISSDGGAYVQAWFWVTDEQAGVTRDEED